MTNIDYSPSGLHMDIRTRVNIGYTGQALDEAMADFADTVIRDYRNGNFDPEDSDSYIGNGNTHLMAEKWETTPALIGEIWNNGRWDGETGTLDEIVYTAVEELALATVEAVAEYLLENEED